MADFLQTRHVLPMLAEQGIRLSRETLAGMSDLLGLRARETEANWSHRRWTPAEVELIALGFRLHQHWDLSSLVLEQLVEHGADCALYEDLASFLTGLEALRSQGRAKLAAEVPAPGLPALARRTA